MQNQKRPLKDSSILSKSRYSIVLLAGIGVCALIIVSFYLLEVMSRYIVISVPLPQDSYNIGWYSTTKSVWTTPAIKSVTSPTVFIWRQDATLSYGNKDNNIPSWNSAAAYFSKQLLEQGWEENDSLISCNIYLPESAFLQHGENGFLSYSRLENHQPENAYEEIPEGDVVCLAIWNDKGSISVLKVVLLTIRQSIFTGFLSVFEL